jgi:hypothetical protein
MHTVASKPIYFAITSSVKNPEIVAKMKPSLGLGETPDYLLLLPFAKDYPRCFPSITEYRGKLIVSSAVAKFL